MFEFLSSPFGLVAVGLGVLAVAVLALCLWITTLDRRMRGMADGLETSQGGRTADGHRAPRQRGPQLREPGEGGSARSRPGARRCCPGRSCWCAHVRTWCGSSGADGGIGRRGRAPAGVRAGFRGRPCGRGAPRTWVAPRPGWQRVDAQQHSDAGAVGGGRLGAGRTGGAAAHRGARSQDVAQGSPRGGARLCRSRGRRVGGSPGSPSPGGRCGPALFRSGAGPRRCSCAPRRSRPSCCGRSRPGPGLCPSAARLRRAFRRPRPPRALGAFPPRASGVSRCAMSLPA